MKGCTNLVILSAHALLLNQARWVCDNCWSLHNSARCLPMADERVRGYVCGHVRACFLICEYVCVCVCVCARVRVCALPFTHSPFIIAPLHSGLLVACMSLAKASSSPSVLTSSSFQRWVTAHVHQVMRIGLRVAGVASNKPVHT